MLKATTSLHATLTPRFREKCWRKKAKLFSAQNISCFFRTWFRFALFKNSLQRYRLTPYKLLKFKTLLVARGLVKAVSNSYQSIIATIHARVTWEQTNADTELFY